MMIKKAALILLAVIMLAAFCGCQLAVEGTTGESNDILCGIFITFESLSFQEEYMNNIDWNAVMTGNGTADAAEAGRIYAVKKADKLGVADYVFEGIEGIRFFQVFVPGDGEQNGYSRTYTGPSLLSNEENVANETEADENMSITETYRNGSLLSDVKNAVNITDTGRDISLEGTLYLCVNPDPQKETGDFVVYSNPVYETPDGRIYTMPAMGGGMYDPTTGTELTQTISGEATWTIDGETKKWSADAKLTVKAIDYIQKYVFKEMDAQDNMISAKEITEGNIPEEIKLSDNTAYAILETWSLDNNGKTVTQRSIVDFSSQYINVMFPTQNGLAEGRAITLNGAPGNREA